ncbi:RICIN domain-containing protein [Planotetraspora silvatica]|nr:RICIN domain-containing protein [Planotetraspora silvatica]
MALITAAAALVAVPLVTAQPAQAAASICSSRYGADWNVGNQGFWWGAAAASRAQSTRMVIDIAGPSTANGALSHIWNWYNGESQYWCLHRINFADGSYAYQMRNYYTGKCLDLVTNPANGSRVKQQDCNSGYPNQRWVQEYVGSVTTPEGSKSGYSFRRDDTNYCLDVLGQGTVAGTPLQVWGCKYSGNQVFY